MSGQAMLFEDASAIALKGATRTEIYCAVDKPYWPMIEGWPPDVAEDMRAVARQWLKRNPSRQLVAVTTACLDTGTGPSCILVLHHTAAEAKDGNHGEEGKG